MTNIGIVFALCVTLILPGCASSLNTQQNQSLVLTKCPSLKSYSQEKMQRAIATLKEIPDDSELVEILSDYGSLREACRLAERRLKALR